MPTITLNIPNTTFVSSAQPDNNLSFYPVMYVGTDANFQTCSGLLQVSLSNLPVAQVDSAMLQLAVISKTGTDPSPVVVNRVEEPFDTATVTYTTRPTTTPTGSQMNISESDMYTRVQIDITALVNSWLSGTYENYGMALTNSDGTTVVQFATNNIVYEPYFPQLILTYSVSPAGSSALNFSYAQLAHVINQIITFYSANTITVYTKGLVASSITGTPYQLYSSAEGTYGGLFIVMDNTQQQAIPLNSITAIYTGEGSVYNPSFTYLPPPQFSAGYDTNIITAYYEYLQGDFFLDVYTGSNIHASGNLYRNEYGIIVLADAQGNNPVFIPVIPITAILPQPIFTLQNEKEKQLPNIAVEESSEFLK